MPRSSKLHRFTYKNGKPIPNNVLAKVIGKTTVTVNTLLNEYTGDRSNVRDFMVFAIHKLYPQYVTTNKGASDSDFNAGEESRLKLIADRLLACLLYTSDAADE